jgi:phage terminase small subunit
MPQGLSAVPTLLQMRVLAEVDRKALAAYCSCYALWMLAEKEIAQYGPTIRNEFGYKVNPQSGCALMPRAK